jgi:hypothetical protein
MLAVVSAPALFAQWPDYPTNGVPMKDSKPDLLAPAPRMPDGKVDLSGIWENGRPNFTQSGQGIGPAVNAAANAADAPPAPTFGNIGAGIKPGLPLRDWAATLLAERKANFSKDNPDAHCLPMGLMQYHMHPQPRRMIQTKDLLVFLYEANSGIRTVFMDGRKLPPTDADPWWFGYSVGHWEDNDTLVVETTNFRDNGWLDVQGSPLTTHGRFIERYRRPNFGTLEIRVTIDDPKAYTAPFTVQWNQRIALNQEMIEFICQENEADAPHLVGKDGKK